MEEQSMHLDSSFAGTNLRDYKTTVTWRHTMNYAAAVNDPNEAYFNDERTGGIIAHPLNCTAITWPIVEQIWKYIETADFPIDLLATQVHFTEHLEFHRFVRPGDELTIKGCIAAIEPHRAGTHVIIRFTAFAKDEKPVFTEHIGGLMRGVTCRGKAAGMESVPGVPKTGSEELQWETTIHIDKLTPFIYDGCTNIFFPIHTSRMFAHQVGLPDIILQGTATLAFAVRDIIDREASGNPERIKKIYCKFTGMVLPSTDIRVRQIGKTRTDAGNDVFFTVLNGDGQKAINNGYVQIK
jgi:acyl dehydratase